MMKHRQTAKCLLLALSLAIIVATSSSTSIVDNPTRKRQPNKKFLCSASQHDLFIVRRGGGGTSGKIASPSTSSPSSSLSTPIVDGLKNSLASGLASCCAKTLLQPFDTIKTMQQHYQHNEDGNNDGSSLGFFEAVHLITSRGSNGSNGFSQLYAGLVVSALGSVPSIGLYYGIYSYCKRILIPFLQNEYGSGSIGDDKGKSGMLLSDSQLKWIAVAISAATGNAVASFSRVPYEVVKQKLQTGVYGTTWQAIATMFHQNGIRAFFPTGGVSIQMIRDIPYAICTLSAYEFLRDTYVSKQTNPSSPIHDMVAGAIAGGFGSIMTNGLDVVKTRLQTNPDQYGGSVVQCIRETFEEGGYRIFLRGSVPRLLHKIPANGSFFLFYELFRRLLRVDDVTTKE